MLSLLRHLFIDSWFGRILVGLVFVVFIGWGGADVWTNYSHRGENNVTNVAGKTITIQELGSAYKRQLNMLQDNKVISDISSLSDMDKRNILNDILSTMVTSNLLLNNAPKLGVVVSDSDIRSYIFSQPIFQENGQYSEEKLNTILSRQQIPVTSFIQDTKDNLTIIGVNTPLAIGGNASTIFIDKVFSFNNEMRSIAYVQIPFDHFNSNYQPSESDLKRFYDNHPWLFGVPEYRHVRAIMLSPESIAKNINISDQEAQQYYNLHTDEYNQDEKRNVQLVTFKDKISAQALVNQSKYMHTWQDIQGFAQKNNGIAVEMNNVRETAFPIPNIGKVIFNTSLNQMSGPIQTTAGWVVFKVAGIVPEKHIAFNAAEKDIKAQLALQQAQIKFSGNLKELQDILAGGSGLDKIFSDLGVVGVEGNFDQSGLTQQGEIAPLPYRDNLKKKVLIDIFSTAKNQPPSLKQGENNTYYAFVVDNIIPAHQATFEEAKDKVLTLWNKNNEYRQANVIATSLLNNAQESKQGVSMLKTSFSIEKSTPFSRTNPDKKIPLTLIQKAFEMNMGETTMVQAGDAFYIMTLSSIDIPKNDSNNAQYKQLMNKYSKSIQRDLLESYVSDLGKKVKLEINQKALDMIVQNVNQ